jgi:hypothetical protein
MSLEKGDPVDGDHDQLPARIAGIVQQIDVVGAAVLIVEVDRAVFPVLLRHSMSPSGEPLAVVAALVVSRGSRFE